MHLGIEAANLRKLANDIERVAHQMKAKGFKQLQNEAQAICNSLRQESHKMMHLALCIEATKIK